MYAYRSTFKIRDVAGIYAIVNTVSHKYYVGQSVAMETRKDDHFRALRHGTHHNAHLQNSYAVYGESAFTFVVLEYVTMLVDLEAREKFWIEELRHTYNIIKDPTKHMECLQHDARHKVFADAEETIQYCFDENEYERPEWHKYVYGGVKRS